MVPTELELEVGPLSTKAAADGGWEPPEPPEPVQPKASGTPETPNSAIAPQLFPM
ncbi:MAG: hypothetical protein ABSC94_21210 [Polyangiaceae bacterium]